MFIFSTHPDRLHPASSVYLGLLPLGVMWPGCEVNHSHLVSRLRMSAAILSRPCLPLWRYRDGFTFILIYFLSDYVSDVR
jgi:hypothetical protein